MGRGVARVGDQLGTPTAPAIFATGSPNVYVEGQRVAKYWDVVPDHYSDLHAPGHHCYYGLNVGVSEPFGTPHQKVSQTVFVNGQGMARLGDNLDCIRWAGGLNQNHRFLTGSVTVYAGD